VISNGKITEIQGMCQEGEGRVRFEEARNGQGHVKEEWKRPAKAAEHGALARGRVTRVEMAG